jgi:RNA polymerase sigma-70 factor (ECF subfamily)
VQAEIALLHAEAESYDRTDWASIADRYRELAVLTGSPVVELNRAVAVAMTDGPEAGLSLIDELADGGTLDEYHLLHAARADLLRRLDRRDEAVAAYERALALAPTAPEQHFLRRRADDLRRA